MSTILITGANRGIGLELARAFRDNPLTFAIVGPIRQAYLNGLIPSAQRATVLSFDGLMGSTGGVVIQPALGRAADVWSYGSAYVLGGAIQLLAAPFALRIRTMNMDETSWRSARAR